MPDRLFTEGKIGNLTLRNRSVRAAAFEGMCPGNKVSDDLIRYHVAVAAGGIGMTTVAYASISRSGLSFPHQLLLEPNAVPALQKLTSAVHREGAAVAIQIGHCGLMADKSISGVCFAPSSKFNLYGPTWPRKITRGEIQQTINDFSRAVQIAIQAGFDAVEVHAGHGYLISQFLSPFTNRRTDEYGGSFENRTRFMVEVIREVIRAAKEKIAVIVKMNLRDGFKGGAGLDDAIQIAQLLEAEGADALVLSGGFVSKTPMYVMRGSMPVKIMAEGMKNPWMRMATRLFGKLLVRTVPFKEAYFLDDALEVREAVSLPLIYVGGLKSKLMIDHVLNSGFDFVQLARVLIHDPCFINRIGSVEVTESACQTSNYCIARMYSAEMRCFQSEPGSSFNQ